MLIRQFQSLMRRIYFHRDSERGAEKTLGWLKEELDELEEAMHDGNENSLAEEFADVLAWLASLANVLEVELQDAAIAKYDKCCPKCSSLPCKCPF